MVGSQVIKQKTEKETNALFNHTFCLPENVEQLRHELEEFHLQKTLKRVWFCEDIQVFYPVMQGQMYCMKKGSPSSEHEALQRHSLFQRCSRDLLSTFCISHAFRKVNINYALVV